MRKNVVEPGLAIMMKLLRGQTLQPSIPKTQILWSWIGAFTGIALISILSHYVLDETGLTLIMLGVALALNRMAPGRTYPPN